MYKVINNIVADIRNKDLDKAKKSTYIRKLTESNLPLYSTLTLLKSLSHNITLTDASNTDGWLTSPIKKENNERKSPVENKSKIKINRSLLQLMYKLISKYKTLNKLQYTVIWTGIILGIILFLMLTYFLDRENAKRALIHSNNVNRIISDRKIVFSFVVAFSAFATKLILKGIITFRMKRFILHWNSIGQIMAHLFYSFFIVGVIVLLFAGVETNYSWYYPNHFFNFFLSIILIFNTSVYGNSIVRNFQRTKK